MRSQALKSILSQPVNLRLAVLRVGVVNNESLAVRVPYDCGAALVGCVGAPLSKHISETEIPHPISRGNDDRVLSGVAVEDLQEAINTVG